MIDNFYRTISPALITRFKEREENVKSDIFHAYIALLRQTKPATGIAAPDPASMEAEEGPVSLLQAQAQALHPCAAGHPGEELPWQPRPGHPLPSLGGAASSCLRDRSAHRAAHLGFAHLGHLLARLHHPCDTEVNLARGSQTGRVSTAAGSCFSCHVGLLQSSCWRRGPRTQPL